MTHLLTSIAETGETTLSMTLKLPGFAVIG
jgi:hypothetical protein